MYTTTKYFCTFLLAMLFIGAGCLPNTESECSGFIPGLADSVQAPQTVNLNDSIVITVFTTLSNGCQTVQPIVPSVTGNSTRLQLMLAVNGCICTQVVTNASTNYAIRALQRGSFTFEVVDAQRTITKTVQVL